MSDVPLRLPASPPPSIETLQVFVRVAELASFTQAAQSLGLPKASASTAVQRLEASLGTRLFHRTTRRVQLTQDGQACYERCKDLLADLDDMQTMFQPAASGLRGRLRVDMPMRIAQDLVVPRLPEFLAAHPGLEVELFGQTIKAGDGDRSTKISVLSPTIVQVPVPGTKGVGIPTGAFSLIAIAGDPVDIGAVARRVVTAYLVAMDTRDPTPAVPSATAAPSPAVPAREAP